MSRRGPSPFEPVIARDEGLRGIHCAIERVTIGYIDELSTAAEGRQLGQGRTPALTAEHEPQRGFNHFGHGPALPRRLLLEAGHDCRIYVEGRLHMANHIRRMVIWRRIRQLAKAIEGSPPRSPSAKS